jgi:hypothetical protein
MVAAHHACADHADTQAATASAFASDADPLELMICRPQTDFEQILRR